MRAPATGGKGRQPAWTTRRLADPRYIAAAASAQLHVREHRTAHTFSGPGRELIRLPGLADYASYSGSRRELCRHRRARSRALPHVVRRR
jgi:hypothetical protein